MNSQTGEFTAVGSVGAIHSESLPFFNGQVSCQSNPYAVCSANLNIDGTKIDIQGSVEPNNFGGKLAIDGKEWLSGSASITETEAETVYSAKAMYDKWELEGTAKTKNAENKPSEPEIPIPNVYRTN